MMKDKAKEWFDKIECFDEAIKIDRN